MLAVLVRHTEGLLPFGRFDGHPFALGFGEGVFVDMGEGEGRAALLEGRRHCPHQPVFENPHTPNTALIEIEPVVHQCLHLDGERHRLEERQQYPLEVTAILLLLTLVPRKMDIQTAPGGLATQVAEG